MLSWFRQMAKCMAHLINWLDVSLLGAIGNTLRLLLHRFYRINNY